MGMQLLLTCRQSHTGSAHEPMLWSEASSVCNGRIVPVRLFQPPFYPLPIRFCSLERDKDFGLCVANLCQSTMLFGIVWVLLSQAFATWRRWGATREAPTASPKSLPISGAKTNPLDMARCCSYSNRKIRKCGNTSPVHCQSWRVQRCNFSG